MPEASPLTERPAPPDAPPSPAPLDAAELERLYSRLEKPMFNVVYRWLWSAPDAQEVVQDAFLRIWRRRDEVRMESVEPLLYRTALNLAANRLRARRVRRWLFGSADETSEPIADEPGAEARAAERERLLAVRRAVEALPEPLKQVLVLGELAGMSYEQVAETLGIPAGTVASRRHQAVARLRAQLGEHR